MLQLILRVCSQVVWMMIDYYDRESCGSEPSPKGKNVNKGTCVVSHALVLLSHDQVHMPSSSSIFSHSVLPSLNSWILLIIF